jgi:hypothetical protein
MENTNLDKTNFGDKLQILELLHHITYSTSSAYTEKTKNELTEAVNTIAHEVAVELPVFLGIASNINKPNKEKESKKEEVTTSKSTTNSVVNTTEQSSTTEDLTKKVEEEPATTAPETNLNPPSTDDVVNELGGEENSDDAEEISEGELITAIINNEEAVKKIKETTIDKNEKDIPNNVRESLKDALIKSGGEIFQVSNPKDKRERKAKRAEINEALTEVFKILKEESKREELSIDNPESQPTPEITSSTKKPDSDSSKPTVENTKVVTTEELQNNSNTNVEEVVIAEELTEAEIDAFVEKIKATKDPLKEVRLEMEKSLQTLGGKLDEEKYKKFKKRFSTLIIKMAETNKSNYGTFLNGGAAEKNRENVVKSFLKKTKPAVITEGRDGKIVFLS